MAVCEYLYIGLKQRGAMAVCEYLVCQFKTKGGYGSL